jgi:hypothetical protein
MVGPLLIPYIVVGLLGAVTALSARVRVTMVARLDSGVHSAAHRFQESA